MASANKFELIYADFPWPYTSFGTAELPYPPMTWEKLEEFPWQDFCAKRFVLFSWVTGPLLTKQILLHEKWAERHGWRYLGIPYIWVKTTKELMPLKATGPRPTLVKPLGEFVIAYTNVKRGRPFPLLTEAQVQWVDDEDNEGLVTSEEIREPRREHSRKPDSVRNSIVELFGDRPRVELFARQEYAGWSAIGAQSSTKRVF